MDRRLADGMWLEHAEFVLHLIDHGWSRYDAEQCWKEATHEQAATIGS